MIIKLQKNLSDNNVLNKQIQDVISITGTLREQTSIYDPTIILECPIATLKDCNYMTIDDFGRKYYIKDVTAVSDKLTQVTAHVDVLTTFREGILNCSCILSKQENQYNLYLDDGTFKSYQNTKINTVRFPNGFNEPNLILLVAGS